MMEPLGIKAGKKKRKKQRRTRGEKTMQTDIHVLKRNFRRMHNIVAPDDEDPGTFRPI